MRSSDPGFFGKNFGCEVLAVGALNGAVTAQVRNVIVFH